LDSAGVRVLKAASCPSLSGKTTLTYEIGCGEGSDVYMRLSQSTGTGSFSKGWVDLQRVHDLLEKNADKPITMATFAPLFSGLSANTGGFLLAVIRHEGLVQTTPENPRCYERLDGKAFFTELERLMGSRTAKPKPSRPAVYVSEVHGPLAGDAKVKGRRPSASAKKAKRSA
jgi:hypothetical protein